MMKYSKIIIILFFGTFLTSCEDFLDPEPTSAIKTEDFYTTIEEIELGVIAIYDAIQGANNTQLNENRGIQVEFYVTEMFSDNSSTRSPDADDSSESGQFENFSVQANNGISANYYSSMYRVIYLSNVVLDAIEALGLEEDDTSADRVKSEASFLRAYAYFNLIRLYGEDSENLGLPLVDHVLSDDELVTQYTRVHEHTIYELIIADLIVATEGLDDTYKTRASKTAAHTLLATVYMTQDTPNYAKAILELDQVGTDYSLLNSYEDIFDPANELNDEIIFAIGFTNDSANDSQNYSAEFAASGNTSGLNYLTSDLHANLVVNGGINRLLFEIDDNDAENRFQTAKHDTNSSDDEQAGTDFIVLRYTDVIMLYAEAYMGGANELMIDGQDWQSDYDLIRTRAGLTPVTSITKDELLAERRYEFFSENKRIFDLKRFGVVNTVLSDFASVNGYRFNSNESTLPIPLREINLSPISEATGESVLIQNINWR